MKKTPKLRFPEFSGEWEEKKLGSLCTFLKGSGLSKDNISTDGKLCILYGELYTKYGEVISKVYSKTNLDGKNFVYSKQNDVLIPSSGETAIDIATASCVQDDGVILGGDLNIMRSTEINGIFLSYQLNNAKRNDLAKVAQGASVVHIYNDQLKKVSVSVPECAEQDKIASFFSLIDKKIEKQQEKVETLEEYKKGMMQKIFSQEIRFKKDDGGEYPEWEDKKLGKLGDIYTGLSGKTRENFGLGKAKYITYMNVFKNIKIDLNMLDLVEIGANETQNKVFKDDILFTTSSETPEEVGMASLCSFECEDLYLNSFCFGFRLNKLENLQGDFLVYLLRSPRIRRKITILAQGSTRYNLSKNELMKMKVEIPCLEEQIKIANFLSNIDTIIEKEKEKLKALRECKKGLLQQMFV